VEKMTTPKRGIPKLECFFKGRCLVDGKLVDCNTEKIDPVWCYYVFDKVFVNLVKWKIGQWIKVPLGASRDDVAPSHLLTSVDLKYVQHENDFCLIYSLCAGLHYMGFEKEAEVLSEEAPKALHQPFEVGIQIVSTFMRNHLPKFGCHHGFGKVKKRRKGNAAISIHDLCTNKYPYPTVVIPSGKDGSVNHAFCIVDDLVFDSTQERALKLSEETIHWSCGNKGAAGIYAALRFNQPVDSIVGLFQREMKTNWNSLEEGKIEKELQTCWIEGDFFDKEESDESDDDSTCACESCGYQYHSDFI